MATYGTVKDLNSLVDDWPTYIERLEHNFIANDVKDEGKKQSILLCLQAFHIQAVVQLSTRQQA